MIVAAAEDKKKRRKIVKLSRHDRKFVAFYDSLALLLFPSDKQALAAARWTIDNRQSADDEAQNDEKMKKRKTFERRMSKTTTM